MSQSASCAAQERLEIRYKAPVTLEWIKKRAPKAWTDSKVRPGAQDSHLKVFRRRFCYLEDLKHLKVLRVLGFWPPWAQVSSSS